MKRAGIGSVVFLEVNVGIPRGHVDFLSTEWKDCFKHAVKECERLGIIGLKTNRTSSRNTLAFYKKVGSS